MRLISQALLDVSWRDSAVAAAKVAALFLTAVTVLRLTERRTLAELAPFDWVAAVATGAIVGRTATAADTSWLTGATALVTLLVLHSVLARLRYLGPVRRLLDPPLRVLVHDGVVDRRNLRRCGLTGDDLAAILRDHGVASPEQVTWPSSRPREPYRCWRTAGRASSSGTPATGRDAERGCP